MATGSITVGHCIPWFATIIDRTSGFRVSTMTVSAHVTQKYNLGPVKSWVSNAAYLLGTKFGFTTIYGWRQTDPYPDHPSGHALDFMISSHQQGEDLKNYAVANHANLGIKYIIWNRTYYADSNGWKGSPYTATSNPHTDHVHITFLDQPGPWISSPGFTPPDTATLTATTQPEEPSSYQCAWMLHLPINGDTCIISKSSLRAVLGGLMLVGGAALMIVGLAFVTVYGLGRSETARQVVSTARKFV